MREMLERAQIQLDGEKLRKLWRFDQLLREHNRDRDLTRLIEFETVVVKHYIDCMYVGNIARLPSPLLDIGTGAGFPGIPLKIRYPELQLVLAEQRPRRVAFLRHVVAELGLRDVEVFEHRVVSRSFTKEMRGVITRAVEPIGKTLLRTSGCTVPGSCVYFMKGPGVDAELAEAGRELKREWKLTSDRPYVLPHTSHQRRLVVFERIARHQPSSSSEADESDRG